MEQPTTTTTVAVANAAAAAIPPPIATIPLVISRLPNGENSASVEFAKKAVVRLTAQLGTAASDIQGVALMPDFAYNSATNTVSGGFAVKMKGTTDIRRVIAAMPLRADGLSMGLSAYEITSFLKDSYNNPDLTLLTEIKPKLRAVMSQLLVNIGLFDADADVAAAAKLVKDHVKTLMENIEIDMIMHTTTSPTGNEVIEQWFLLVRANDALGSLATLAALLKASDAKHSSAKAFARKCETLSANGDILRNAIAAHLGDVFGLKFRGETTRTKSPWSARDVAVVAPQIKNEYNIAVVANQNQDVVLYVKSIAGPLAFGGVIYRHTRTQGVTIVRSHAGDGTLKERPDIATYGALPLGFPRINADESTPIEPDEALTEDDEKFIRSERIMWGQANVPYHGRVLSGLYSADALMATNMDSRKKEIYNTLYSAALFGKDQDRYAKLKFVTRLAWVPGKSNVRMMMPDWLRFLKKYEPARPVPYPWKQFMIMFVTYRDRLDSATDEYSLASIGKNEVKIGKVINVDVDLLYQLLAYHQESELKKQASSSSP